MKNVTKHYLAFILATNHFLHPLLSQETDIDVESFGISPLETSESQPDQPQAVSSRRVVRDRPATEISTKQTEQFDAQTQVNSDEDFYPIREIEINQVSPEMMPQDFVTEQAVIPTRKPLERYESLWRRSPFVIATPTAAAPAQQNSQYSLASVIKVGDEYFAHVIESATQRRLPVSKQPSPDHGLVLIDVREDPIPSRTTATITVRGAPMTISFDSSSFSTMPGGSVASMQNMNPAFMASGTIPGMPQQSFPNQQQMNQQQLMQQQMIQQQLMQQQMMQQQQQQMPGMPANSTQLGSPPMPGGIMPPDVVPTRRIIRRRVTTETDNPMQIPPNTIVNPPTQ